MDELVLLAKLNSPSLLAPLPIPVSLKHQLFLLIKYTSVFHACFIFTEELLLEKLKATSLYGFQICYLTVITGECHLTKKDTFEHELN